MHRLSSVPPDRNSASPGLVPSSLRRGVAAGDGVVRGQPHNDRVVNATMVSRILNSTAQKSLRRKLRGNATLDECLLWNALKGRQLMGRKFRRQQSVGPYVVDFYCPSERLIVEVDGSSHDTASANGKDVLRGNYLRQAGFRILRFKSREIRGNLEGVLAEIVNVLIALPRRAEPATHPRRGGD